MVSTPPGFAPGKCAPFSELDEYTFQDLCRELMSIEPAISHSDVYGNRGQKQFGVDIIAHRPYAGGIELGQCKCYGALTVADAKKVSDEFLKYWDTHWKDKDVKRFVLFVASDITDRNVIDELLKQKAVFKTLGIEYEYWSGTTISDKLRPHRAVATQYLRSAEWVDRICGSVNPALTYACGNDSAVVLLQNALEDFKEDSSNQYERNFTLMRQAWREGRGTDARDWVREVKSNRRIWPHLTAIIRAKIICFEAALTLDIDDDVDASMRLLDEADSITPTPNASRTRAYLKWRESGDESALSLLDGLGDPDSRNMRAAMFIEAGRAADALALLQAECLQEANQSCIEGRRLRALALLIIGNTAQARVEIESALTIAPNWRDLQLAAAYIDYYCILTPFTPLERRPPWPEPVEPVLVRHDSDSLLSLRSATQRFCRLRETATNDKERAHLDCWILACLTLDEEQRAAAVEHCRAILEHDPADFCAIAWALAYDLCSDLEKSEQTILSRITACTVTVPQLAVLINYYLSRKRAEDALRLLESTRSLFEQHQSLTVWTVWHIQSLVAVRNIDEALAAIDKEPVNPIFQELKAFVLRSQAVQTGDWQPVIAYLQSLIDATNNPYTLFNYCKVLASQHRWDEVADQGTALLHQMPLSDVVELVAVATSNSKRFDQCLQILDDYKGCFIGSILPPILRRIRVYCLRGLNRQNEAIAVVNEFVTVQSPTEDLLLLARLYYDTLDIPNLVLIARNLSTRDDLPIADALMIAGLIKGDDLSLAQTIWRSAEARDIPDDLTGTAVALGFELGLDREVGSIFQRAVMLGSIESGGVTTASTDEVVKMLTEHRQRSQEIFDKYRRGEIPIHFIAEHGNISLAEIYHTMLLSNEADPNPLEQASLYTRHGGRCHDLQALPDPSTWILHLDVTAFLLAAHIEILPLIEKLFAPVNVPSSLAPALYRMRTKAQAHQPSQIEAYQLIERLMIERRLNIYDRSDLPEATDTGIFNGLEADDSSLVAHAVSTGGRMVAFLPLRDLYGKPYEITPDVEKVLVNCAVIADALLELSLITDTDRSEYLDRLGNEGQCSSGCLPIERGTPLYCDSGVVTLLASSGLLQRLCTYFPVHIDEREYDKVRQGLAKRACDDELERWLTMLMERIRCGIESGSYRQVSGQKDDASDECDPIKDSPEVACLTTIMGCPAGDTTVFWVDDRWVNGSPWGKIVVDTTDVLMALVALNAISEEEQYAKLYRLRAANLRYLPLLPEEITTYLCKSPVIDQEMRPQRQLIVLQRYIAACIMQHQDLRYIPDGMNEYGPEIPYLVSIPRLIEGALISLWTVDKGINGDRATRAEWFLRYLHVNHAGLNAIVGIRRGEDAERYITGLALAGFLSHGLSWPTDAKDWREQRLGYMAWVFKRIIAPAIEKDPSVLPATAKVLSALTKPVIEQFFSEHDDQVLRVMIALYFESLPEQIKEELAKDKDYLKLVGSDGKMVIGLDDLHFEADAFWNAVSQVINKRPGIVTPLGRNDPIELLVLEQGGVRGVSFIHPDNKFCCNLHLHMPQLFADDISFREEALRENKELIDCSPNHREDEIRRIAAIELPADRQEEVEQWKNRNIDIFYQQLEGKDTLSITDLRQIRHRDILNYLRLQSHIPDGMLRNALEESAEQLISDLGIGRALERFMGMPVPLPARLINEVEGLDPSDRRALFIGLLQFSYSPIARINYLRLLAQWSDDCPAYTRLARRIAKRLLSETGRKEILAFGKILSWVGEEINVLHEAQAWSVPVQLSAIWSHAHKLYLVFAKGDPDPDIVSEWLSQFTHNRLTSLMLHWPPELWLDIAYQHRFKASRTLLFGLAYAFGSSGKIAFTEFQLTEAIKDVAFMRVEDSCALVFDLFTDGTQAYDSLGSFLYGSLGDVLYRLLGEEVSLDGMQVKYGSLVADSIDNIQTQANDFNAWTTIIGVLGELPPYEAVKDQMASVFKGIKFGELNWEPPQYGALALQFAATQALHMKDQELLGHLRCELLSLARQYAITLPNNSRTRAECESYSEDDACRWLLEAAIWIALAKLDPAEIAKEFASILAELVDSWRITANAVLPVIQLCCEELPYESSQHFWPLLVRLRTM